MDSPGQAGYIKRKKQKFSCHLSLYRAGGQLDPGINRDKAAPGFFRLATGRSQDHPRVLNLKVAVSVRE